MKDTKTFAEDLFFFAKTYVDDIVLKIVEHAPEIAKNEVLVDLLHEAHVRADEDEATFARKFTNDVTMTLANVPEPVLYFTGEVEVNTARHSCLKNAKSYRDVCRDLIWKIIGEED